MPSMLKQRKFKLCTTKGNYFCKKCLTNCQIAPVGARTHTCCNISNLWDSHFIHKVPPLLVLKLSTGWLRWLPTGVWVDFDLDLSHLPCQFCLVPICLGRIRQTLEHLNPMQPNVGRRPPESPCILNLTNRRPTSSRRSGGWWRSWKWLKSAWWARRRGGTGPSPGLCWRWRTKSVR